MVSMQNSPLSSSPEEGSSAIPGPGGSRDGDTILTEGSTVSQQGLEPKLVFRNGPCRGKVVPLDGERIGIGRGSQNQVVLDVGLIVSSQHAALVRDSDDGSWWIEDLESKNGTFVNGA